MLIMVVVLAFQSQIENTVVSGNVTCGSELPVFIFLSSQRSTAYTGDTCLLMEKRHLGGSRIMPSGIQIYLDSSNVLHIFAAGPLGSPHTADVYSVEAGSCQLLDSVPSDWHRISLDSISSFGCRHRFDTLEQALDCVSSALAERRER